MKRKTLVWLMSIVLANVLLWGPTLGFLGGYAARDKALESLTISNERKLSVVNFVGCLHSIDSDLMRFVDTPTSTIGVRLLTRSIMCESQLDIVGKTLNDSDRVDILLAEAKMFYQGYCDTALEIMKRQLLLEDMYIRHGIEKAEEAMKLEMEQARQIREADNFLGRISLLMSEAW